MADEVEVKMEEVVSVSVADAPVVAVEAPVIDATTQAAVDTTKTESTPETAVVEEQNATEMESDKDDDDESYHPALSLLDKLEAKLFFVETAIATEIKQVIEEIKSHL